MFKFFQNFRKKRHFGVDVFEKEVITFHSTGNHSNLVNFHRQLVILEKKIFTSQNPLNSLNTAQISNCKTTTRYFHLVSGPKKSQDCTKILKICFKNCKNFPTIFSEKNPKRPQKFQKLATMILIPVRKICDKQISVVQNKR